MGQKLEGLPASSGIAVGPAWWYSRPDIQVTQKASVDTAQELERFRRAVGMAHDALKKIIQEQEKRLSPEEIKIFKAQLLMLEDPELISRTEAAIMDGNDAAWAWDQETTHMANALASLPDPYFQARAADVRDIARRVLEHLTGAQHKVELPAYPIVLLADDLMPSDTVNIDPKRVLAFCTAGGGPTSHTAILARRLGIPAVVGVGEALYEVTAGVQVLVDGDRGEVWIDPPAERVTEAQERRSYQARMRSIAASAAHEPAVTRDGTQVEVAANVATLEDAREAFSLGADAIGLLRTEFLYLNRTTAPDEEEQYHIYREIFQSMRGKPVVVRTLDVGGDKPLPYIPLPKEGNPFLGVRAIRLAREHPELLHTQLRAILRASTGCRVRVMFPMVATVEEIQWLREMFNRIVEDLRRSGVELSNNIQMGMMVEIPAAALLAEAFCPYVDFFSIGTNDLSQYTLAADRTNPHVAFLADGLHPAVLRLIDRVVQAAHEHGKWVGVCGETASETAAVPILLGLGVDELSVTPNRIPEVKALVRALHLDDARRLAQEALHLTSPAEVRDLVVSSTK